MLARSHSPKPSRQWVYWLSLILVLAASCRPARVSENTEPAPFTQSTETLGSRIDAAPLALDVTGTPVPAAGPWATASPLSPSQPAVPPTLTPTPTPAYGWRYWPNASDLRAVAADGKEVWMAALSGLVHYMPQSGQWQVWTTADGLIENACESVLVWQDRVWVGTQGGVSRYDPGTNTWRSYTTTHGLPGLHNTHLYLDAYDSTLWAGTLEGLAVYDPLADHWIEHTSGTRLTEVSHFWATRDSLWVSALAGDDRAPGIWRLDKSTGQWENVPLAPDVLPADDYALAGSEDRLWVVGKRGIPYEYNLLTQEWRVLDQARTGATNYYQWPQYNAPFLWLWGRTGWIRYDVQTQQLSRVPPPTDPAPIPQGNMSWGQETAWMPTQSGLYALDLQTGRWTSHVRPDAPSEFAQILAAPGERLLVSTGREIGFFDPLAGAWQPIPSPVGHSGWKVPSAALNSDASQVWILNPALDPRSSGSAELWPYTRAGASYEAAPEPILAPADLGLVRLLSLVDQESLWFVAQDGLVAYHLPDKSWHTFSLSGLATHLVDVEQLEGAIWLLTQGKTLTRFDARLRQFDPYTIPFGQGWSHVALSGEAVWLAGNSGTLLSIDWRTRRWVELALDGECSGNRIVALAMHGDSVWMSGETGVTQVRLREQKQTCYRPKDGMLAQDPTQIISSGDWIWFLHPWQGLWGYGPIVVPEGF